MKDRLLGLLLFVPVPVVLWLFTQAPAGVFASLAVGTVVMVTHRLYARPFALSRSERRCLWCGRSVSRGLSLVLQDPLGETSWRTCGEEHSGRLVHVFTTAHRWRWFLRIGILGALTVFFILALAGGGVPSFPVSFAESSALFRFLVAVTVLPVGWLAAVMPYPREATLSVPFPVHIQALIGTSVMLWLFRIVGLVWLVVSVRHFLLR